jgi:predicted CopG family antitoxin
VLYQQILSDKRSSIQVTDKLREELKELGKKGESYEDVIWRLVNFYKKINK